MASDWHDTPEEQTADLIVTGGLLAGMLAIFGGVGYLLYRLFT